MPTKEELVTALAQAMTARAAADHVVSTAKAALEAARTTLETACQVERNAQNALNDLLSAAEKEKGKPNVVDPEI